MCKGPRGGHRLAHSRNKKTVHVAEVKQEGLSAPEIRAVDWNPPL